ncbi:MAG: glutaminyl-peptide cyclotransferase [Planctomycetaceae bacterium]
MATIALTGSRDKTVSIRITDPVSPADPPPPSARARRLGRWFAACLLLIVAAIGLMAAVRSASTPVSRVEVVNVFPHDSGAFCQGLVHAGGRLYEGTGQYGESTLREVELESGRVLRKVDLDERIFGEGIALWGDSIVQLTWKQRRAYAYNRETFAHRRTFRYPGEGWGLTQDGAHLIMSDGSSTLRFLDPATFQEIRRISVHDGRRRIDKLNELEYVRGEIYANIWYEDLVARISPADGRVLGWLDLRSLWPAHDRPDKEHVLNGIAYDAEHDRLFVTGKYWPRLYEIRVVGE